MREKPNLFELFRTGALGYAALYLQVKEGLARRPEGESQPSSDFRVHTGDPVVHSVAQVNHLNVETQVPKRRKRFGNILRFIVPLHCQKDKNKVRKQIINKNYRGQGQ